MKFVDRSLRAHRLVRGFAVALALVLLASACGDDDDDGGSSATTAAGGSATTVANTDPFKIPVIGDLSGSLGTQGAAGVAGIQAAVKVANDAGGISGHKIELGVPIDTLSTPEGAAAAAVRAVSDKPIAMVGQAFSGALAGMVPTLEQAKIPYVSAQGLDNLLYPPAKWFFTTSSTSGQQSAFQVAKVKQLLGGSLSGKKIAFIGLQSPAVDVVANSLKTAVEKEGGSLITERTASGQIASFTSQASNLAQAKPDAIVNIDSAANTILTSKALTDAGYKGPITSSTGANDDPLLQSINLPNFYAPRAYNQLADSKTMADAVKAAGISTERTSNAFFAQGYAAGVSLVEGLRKCGFPCSAEKFPPALETAGNISIGDVGFGPLKYAADRHHGLSALQFVTWDNTAKKSIPSGPPIERVHILTESGVTTYKGTGLWWVCWTAMSGA